MRSHKGTLKHRRWAHIVGSYKSEPQWAALCRRFKTFRLGKRWFPGGPMNQPTYAYLKLHE